MRRVFAIVACVCVLMLSVLTAFADGGGAGAYFGPEFHGSYVIAGYGSGIGADETLGSEYGMYGGLISTFLPISSCSVSGSYDYETEVYTIKYLVIFEDSYYDLTAAGKPLLYVPASGIGAASVSYSTSLIGGSSYVTYNSSNRVQLNGVYDVTGFSSDTVPTENYTVNGSGEYALVITVPSGSVVSSMMTITVRIESPTDSSLDIPDTYVEYLTYPLDWLLDHIPFLDTMVTLASAPGVAELLTVSMSLMLMFMIVKLI